MENIKSLENKEQHAQEESAHFQRLMTALGGTGVGWSYSGVCLDCAGQEAYCACGHRVRYLFELVKAECASVYVGSTCVQYAPGLDPSVLTNIEAEVARIREAINKVKRGTRDAERQQAIQKLVAEAKQLATAVHGAKALSRTHYVCKEVYYFRFGFNPGWLEEGQLYRFGYKTANGLLKRLTAICIELRAVLKAHNMQPPRPRRQQSLGRAW